MGLPLRTSHAMARELGVIAELLVAETLIGNKHSTFGFDATTQEGQHVNSIHFTTEGRYLAVDELPGGTAADYHCHIT